MQGATDVIIPLIKVLYIQLCELTMAYVLFCQNDS